jgi:hypothetical protein
MKWSPSPTDVRWWFWIVTLVFIIAALAGWTPGYYLVMAISAFQILYFLAQEKSLSAWPVQVRIFYFAWSLLGLWPAGRVFFYALLLLGTIMGAFFGRCSITMILKLMPWNQGRLVHLY